MSDKQWTIQESDEEVVRALQKELKIDSVFCHLLVQRGIDNYKAAYRFFRPRMEDLHDPFLMKDMDRACDRLKKAVEEKEKILLYGDYDVDGTTSVALMFSFLQQIGVVPDYYIPDRYKEGYGISLEGIAYASKHNIDLIVAMDCGITAVEQVERARQEGIDMIICDHHLPGEEFPKAVAVLDPKRPDCPYPYDELSGCGIAFKLAQAYVEKGSLPWKILEELLDLLVISIASDIVPITGENRVLALYGLKQLNQTQRPGLKALIDKSGRTYPLKVSDIVFGMAPMINAAGRLADADQAVKLMLASNLKVADDYVRVLEYRNKLRKEFDQVIFEEASELFMKTVDWENRKSIVLYQPHWHKGVIGIAASRLVESFYRPTIILTKSGGMAVGSARSVRKFDIFEALRSCQDLLVNFGGHKYAAGLSLRPEYVQSFQDRFEAMVQVSLEDEQLVQKIPIDAEIKLKEITADFWKVLKQFAPFGPGNQNPIFSSKAVQDQGYSRRLKGGHLRLYVAQEEGRAFNGIAFGQGHHFPDVISGSPFDICFTVNENFWKGNRSLQLVVKDIRI